MSYSRFARAVLYLRLQILFLLLPILVSCGEDGLLLLKLFEQLELLKLSDVFEVCHHHVDVQVDFVVAKTGQSFIKFTLELFNLSQEAALLVIIANLW